eukprot:GHVQ01013606.1.p2 GENE.GHVQ01013606.1~~GHVQ01013606.1.p2  ORF type:complete len:153 (-),score=13.98 GHVQ01013606.1:837-1295(-)
MSLSFTFFSTEAAPPSLAEYEAQAQDFISKWLLAESCHLVVITSGGTSVPLEAETVRFVDNFSTGRRGATMAEHFINEDYWVIFVSRPSSQQPFVRHLTPAGHLETRYFIARISLSSAKCIGCWKNLACCLVNSSRMVVNNLYWRGSTRTKT